MISFLIAQGASLEEASRFGWNAVHFAAAGGHCDGLRQLLDLCDVWRLGRLIETTDCNGSTPIHLACTAGHFGTVQLLLERGANPIAPDFQDLLAVEKAAKRADHSTTFLMLSAMAGLDWFRERAQSSHSSSTA